MIESEVIEAVYAVLAIVLMFFTVKKSNATTNKTRKSPIAILSRMDILDFT